MPPIPMTSLADFERGAWSGGEPLPRRVAFARDTRPPPPGGLQVQFPRLELVLDGVYRNELCDAAGGTAICDLEAGDALFVGANCWNRPVWDADVRLLSLLIGSKHFGLSLLFWDAGRGAFGPVEKRSGPLSGNSPLYHMAAALAGCRDAVDAPYLRPQVEAVVEYARTLVAQAVSADERRSAALHRAACLYLEENLGAGITRERIARQFGVSPNYLSRVFRDQGGVTFSEFVAARRVGTAQWLLEAYDLPLAEVAQRCGFRDVNYFLKVFKKRVGRTPTEYRASIRAHGMPRA
jgi:AraC-like DNA-binding protein